MKITRKIGLGLVSGALVLAGSLGAAAIATADTTTPTPPGPGQQAGFGPRGGAGMAGMRAMDGSGYGVQALADYLAKGLGVTPEAVSDALTSYHATNQPGRPGRDVSVADREAQHDALAAYLATALGKDASAIETLLANYQDYRQTDRTAQIKQALGAKVEAGTITQAQADAMIAAHSDGQGPMGMRMGKGPRG